MTTKHKYSVGDKIVTTDGRVGVITNLETSIVDNVTIPSYWVLFGKEVYPDGYPRNTWEQDISKKRDCDYLNRCRTSRTSRYIGKLMR